MCPLRSAIMEITSFNLNLSSTNESIPDEDLRVKFELREYSKADSSYGYAYYLNFFNRFEAR